MKQVETLCPLLDDISVESPDHAARRPPGIGWMNWPVLFGIANSPNTIGDDRPFGWGKKAMPDHFFRGI